MNRKGQATTELAVFGSLILVCFAVLVSYGQSLQEQQILKQQAFRKALEKAYNENAFVTYNIMKNPRTANVFGRYGEGGRSSTSAAASVNWNLGNMAESGYYQINEDELKTYDKISYEAEEGMFGFGKKIEVTVRIFDENGNVKAEETYDADKDEEISKLVENNEIKDFETEVTTSYKGQETRAEDAAKIASAKKANLIETLITRLKIKVGSDMVVTQGLDTDGRYRQSAAGTEISKEREWATPHAE